MSLRRSYSTNTILTFDNRDAETITRSPLKENVVRKCIIQSNPFCIPDEILKFLSPIPSSPDFEETHAQNEISEIVSTSHIPGMDNAAGSAAQGARGRRRLRLGALTLGSLMSMHCRVAASALTGGFFIFMLFLILMTTLLANPLRHFEVYLGQWSISGPGRAFRVIPALDGIGIAMCISALVRAIVCCTIAAISAIYVFHAVSDATLPYTYCRDFDLKPYDPVLKEVTTVMMRETRFSLMTGEIDDGMNNVFDMGLNDTKDNSRKRLQLASHPYKLPVCLETYTDGYPTLYSTPEYNFFYVEVVSYRSNYNFGHFNMPLLFTIVLVWSLLWILLIAERIIRGRLIWNNMFRWLVAVPWAWDVVLLIAVAVKFLSMPKTLHSNFNIGAKEVLGGMTDAFEVALYIHSAGMGTEIIHGKGLNHYAAGHIDPMLNSENVWHSGLILLMSGLHSGSAALCALADSVQPNTHGVYSMYESTIWIIPMYSKCTLINNYSHFMALLVFGGLSFSYITVAFVLVKTALHTIFEYKVKLVFAEQAIVAALILCCMGLSLLFATTGGIALLESVDAIMSGVGVPFVCVLELVALLYVYRSRDFVSDMNVATEDNACASRIGTQWQIIPVITLVVLIMKSSVLPNAEMPTIFMWVACSPLVGVVIAVPLRTAFNAYTFFKSTTRN